MTEQVSREAAEAAVREVEGARWEAYGGGQKAVLIDAVEKLLQAALAIERPRIEADFAERLAGELEEWAARCKRLAAEYNAKPLGSNRATALEAEAGVNLAAAKRCRELASGEPRK